MNFIPGRLGGDDEVLLISILLHLQYDPTLGVHYHGVPLSDLPVVAEAVEALEASLLRRGRPDDVLSHNLLGDVVLDDADEAQPLRE